METTYNTQISNEYIVGYLSIFKNRTFKIIPLRESFEPTLIRYIESLIQELLSMDLILKNSIGIELINNLQVLLSENCITFKEVKKQTFHCLDILEKMIKLLEVDSNEL